MEKDHAKKQLTDRQITFEQANTSKNTKNPPLLGKELQAPKGTEPARHR